MPTITAQGWIGITESCSRVPASFSRTSPSEVIMVPIRVITRPMIAGTSTQEVLRSGLNNASAWSAPPLCPMASLADCEVNSAEPSR